MCHLDFTLYLKGTTPIQLIENSHHLNAFENFNLINIGVELVLTSTPQMLHDNLKSIATSNHF